ncbi:MAG: hypothetical protein KDM81_14650, partial [Verrucomicrobiae bacterium]|nr:hypothetical protein [Verrucomicrobiae bacterium]
MNELRFSCSKCGQHLKAEPGCGGTVIQCPLCQAHVRIPASPEAAEDGSLPTAWETASLPTPMAGKVCAAVDRAGLGDGPPGSADDPLGAGSEGWGERKAGSGSATLLAGGLVLAVAGAGLWFWKPWETGTPLAPEAASTTPGAGSQAGAAAGRGGDELPWNPPATPPPAAVASGSTGSTGPVANADPGDTPTPVIADPGVEDDLPAGRLTAWTESWTVDFATLPDDARAVVEAQLEPLGLAVSPSIYTATTGRKVTLPARRGTRLEVIEEVGRQIGWTPRYDGRQLKFERGTRDEPVAFAGPFLLAAVLVTPTSSYATAEITLRLTGVGIPDSLRKTWIRGFDGLQQIRAQAPDGTDLADPYGGRWSIPTGANPRLMEAEQVVGLWHAFRGVTRVSSLHAQIMLAGLPAPQDRLEFEFADLPLKPGPGTPETERPLAYNGDEPVVARVHSIIPEVPFDRAR